MTKVINRPQPIDPAPSLSALPPFPDEDPAVVEWAAEEARLTTSRDAIQRQLEAAEAQHRTTKRLPPGAELVQGIDAPNLPDLAQLRDQLKRHENAVAIAADSRQQAYREAALRFGRAMRPQVLEQVAKAKASGAAFKADVAELAAVQERWLVRYDQEHVVGIEPEMWGESSYLSRFIERLTAAR